MACVVTKGIPYRMLHARCKRIWSTIGRQSTRFERAKKKTAGRFRFLVVAILCAQAAPPSAEAQVSKALKGRRQAKMLVTFSAAIRCVCVRKTRASRRQLSSYQRRSFGASRMLAYLAFKHKHTSSSLQVERQLRISMQEECIRLAQPITGLGDFEVPLLLPEDEVARELQQALLEEGSQDSYDEEDEGKQKQLAITVRVRRKGKTGTAKGAS